MVNGLLVDLHLVRVSGEKMCASKVMEKGIYTVHKSFFLDLARQVLKLCFCHNFSVLMIQAVIFLNFNII